MFSLLSSAQYIYTNYLFNDVYRQSFSSDYCTLALYKEEHWLIPADRSPKVWWLFPPFPISYWLCAEEQSMRELFTETSGTSKECTHGSSWNIGIHSLKLLRELNKSSTCRVHRLAQARAWDWRGATSGGRKRRDHQGTEVARASLRGGIASSSSTLQIW